ncbi:DUF2637 domain-containing protein [Streptomyces sp. NPDC060131]|uniref:DUF2637 domain-containing protein n=1 Tax=unclassified Streptomyces TaxID=2593676 RepID=UPI00364D41EE
MTTTTQETVRPAVPPLTRPEMGLAGFGALAAAGVGALGLIFSFDAVSDAAAGWGFSEAWMVPVGMDVAIPVFSVANVVRARQGIRTDEVARCGGEASGKHRGIPCRRNACLHDRHRHPT